MNEKNVNEPPKNKCETQIIYLYTSVVVLARYITAAAHHIQLLTYKFFRSLSTHSHPLLSLSLTLLYA